MKCLKINFILFVRFMSNSQLHPMFWSVQIHTTHHYLIKYILKRT